MFCFTFFCKVSRLISFLLLLYLMPVLLGSIYFGDFIVLAVVLPVFMLLVISYSVKVSGNFRSFQELPVSRLTYLVLLVYLVLTANHLISLTEAVMSNSVNEYLLEITIERYSNNSGMSLLSRLRVITTFIIVGEIARSKLSRLSLSALVLIATVEITDGLSRSSVLILMAWFTLNRSIFKRDVLHRLNLLMISSLCFMVLGGLFYVTQWARVYDQENVGDIMQKKIGEYIIAPAYVYYTDMKTFSSLDFSYGMSTFGVIKKLLGQTIQSGVYDHIYTPYGRTVIRFWTYGFREDFGFLGLLFFLFLVFYSASLIDKYKMPILVLRAFIFCSFIVFYPIISPYTYFNITIGVVLSLFMNSIYRLR